MSSFENNIILLWIEVYDGVKINYSAWSIELIKQFDKTRQKHRVRKKNNKFCNRRIRSVYSPSSFLRYSNKPNKLRTSREATPDKIYSHLTTLSSSEPDRYNRNIMGIVNIDEANIITRMRTWMNYEERMPCSQNCMKWNIAMIIWLVKGVILWIISSQNKTIKHFSVWQLYK